MLKKTEQSVKRNKTMDLRDNIQRIISSTSISFQERELIIYRGLLRYVTNCVGEYLTVEQIEKLTKTLRRLRNRQAEVSFDEALCDCITDSREIRNLYIPRKTLRRDEAALLIYNLAPYALLNRRETAQLAKCLFPNFFGAVGTINTMFTKLYGVGGTICEVPKTLIIEVMPDHSTYTIEKVFYELGYVEIDKTRNI